MSVTTIDIHKYLQIAQATGKLPKRDFWTTYDSTADVLYITFYQQPLPSDDSEITDDDLIIRYNEQEEIIGITILHASKR